MIQTSIRAMLLALLFVCATPSMSWARGFHHGRVVYIGGVPYIVRGHHRAWAYPMVYGYAPSTAGSTSGGGGSGGGDEPSGNEAARPGEGSDGSTASNGSGTKPSTYDSEIADLRIRVREMERRLDESDRMAPASIDQAVDTYGLRAQQLHDDAVELAARRDILLVQIKAFGSRIPTQRTDLLKRLDDYSADLKALTLPK